MASNQVPNSSSQHGRSSRGINLRRATRVLTAQYEKIVGMIPKLAKGRKPEGFPQFAKLPEELQLKIWQFAALLPRVIKLGMATTQKFGRTRYHHWRIIDYSGVHPLLVTTYTSRQTALATFGDGYSVDRVDPNIRTCYTIRYNPLNDTIFVSDLNSLNILSRCYHICPKSRPLSKAGLTVVKSLALGRIWLPDNLRTGYSDTNSDGLFDSVSHFLCAIDFTALEELILIDPTIAKETNSRNFIGKPIRKLVPLSKEHRQHLTDLLQFLSERLKEDMQRYGNSRDDVLPAAVSSWWENPVITVMTEEQFKARFNAS